MSHTLTGAPETPILAGYHPAGTVVTLTPALAQRLLDANPRNRRVSGGNYAVIKRAIEHGEWLLNGEAIKVSADGELLDGQHRCRAVVETGISIETFLITGLPSDAQDTMDTGKSRSLADVLGIHGEPNANGLAALIRRFYVSERFGFAAASKTGSANLTIREQLDWLARNPWVRNYPAPGKMVGRHVPSLSGSTAGFLMGVFDSIDQDDSDFFWARLMDGANLSVTHPIYVLRKTLTGIADSTRGQLNQTYIIAIIVKAWNSYRAGESISMLKFRVGGAKPETFPVPR